jgi:hypothetical protein
MRDRWRIVCQSSGIIRADRQLTGSRNGDLNGRNEAQSGQLKKSAGWFADHTFGSQSLDDVAPTIN